jgi:hypothetical protein
MTNAVTVIKTWFNCFAVANEQGLRKEGIQAKQLL